MGFCYAHPRSACRVRGAGEQREAETADVVVRADTPNRIAGIAGELHKKLSGQCRRAAAKTKNWTAAREVATRLGQG